MPDLMLFFSYLERSVTGVLCETDTVLLYLLCTLYSHCVEAGLTQWESHSSLHIESLAWKMLIFPLGAPASF